jgi:hypothetical protein
MFRTRMLSVVPVRIAYTHIIHSFHSRKARMNHDVQPLGQIGIIIAVSLSTVGAERPELTAQCNERQKGAALPLRHAAAYKHEI